ncbi:hypothetical protein C1645_128370 [Glomus cerebriforme]|uniref:Cytochrome b5 heme-binding domain-containing protein n=1 Tax=Glomus cerebriforme TaxID=658196 RepID=A0A397T4X0_9GLOM|nr:hypothetical protein C1645_128370 [Glomus cerebriforme]
MKYIMAYNPTSSGFSYHGNNRIMIFINFFTQEVGAASITDLQRETRLFHGIGMFLTWCLLFPISIFVVRFRKHTNNYLKIHRAIQLIGGISVSSFGAAAIATMTNTKSSHAWTGLVIYIIVFFEMGLGLVSIWGQAVIISVNHGYPRFAKRTHKVFGITLLLSAWVNIYLGIDTFTLSFGYKPLFWKVFYAVWTLILIVIFIIGEYWWRKGSYSKINHIEEAKLDKRKSMRYNNKDHDDLPEFTWEDINERVQRGAFLVVCDGLVVDVRKWIGVHPGGAKILEKVVGTDITNDFYNTHKEMIINEDVETPETRLLLADKSNDYNISNLEKHDDTTEGKQNFGRLIKNYNVARIIDKINTKYCSNSPLATHGHSTFAIKKMLDMY